MTLLGVVCRSLHHQKFSSVLLLRCSSALSATSDASATTVKQACILQRPQRHAPLCSFSNSRQKSTDTDVPSKVDIGPGTWHEIYHGILTTQIRMVKLFSLSTSCLGVLMQPVLIQQVGTNIGLAIAAGSFIGFFTFVTPFLIHWITKKYVTRLEYDPQSDIYSATTLSFFLREKKIHFRIQDVDVPAVPGIFTTFHAKNKPLFVEPRMFENVEHFGRIMGYDKPIDFKLEEEEEEQQK